MDYKHEVIFCIVNAGFSDMVMDAAREFGARGGTVIHARGTANVAAEKVFNISIQPEKDIVMILVESEIRDDILHSLYKNVGLQSAGGGIAFSMPVEDVVGLAAKSKPTEAQKEKQIAKDEKGGKKQERDSADQQSASETAQQSAKGE